MPREFDHLLIQRAQKAGARVHERTEAVTPMFETGWVTGARVRPSDDRDAEPTEIRARFTIAADGAASRFAKPAGCAATIPGRWASPPAATTARRTTRALVRVLARPVGGRPVAARLRVAVSGRGRPDQPGGGLLNTFKDFKQISAQRLFDAFSTMLPAAWEILEAAEDGCCRVRCR